MYEFFREMYEHRNEPDVAIFILVCVFSIGLIIFAFAGAMGVFDGT